MCVFIAFIKKIMLVLIWPSWASWSNSLFCRSPSGRQWCPNNADPAQFETNEAVLKRRQKQIQYGKNTCGYLSYAQQIPKWELTNYQLFPLYFVKLFIFFLLNVLLIVLKRHLFIIFPNCSGVCVCLGFTLPLQTNTANIAADLGICKSVSGGERFIHGTHHLLPRKTWRDKTLLINCKSSKTVFLQLCINSINLRN